MTVVNPNIGDAPATTFNAAAVTDRTDEFAGRSAALGTGVVSGLAVAGNGSASVTVAGGAVEVQGVPYTVASVTLAVATNAGALDRRDAVIYRVGTGVTILQGTSGSYAPGSQIWTTSASISGTPPVKPDITESTDVVLAEIYMPYNAASVSSGVSAALGTVIDKTNVLAPGSQALVRTAAFQNVPDRPGATGAGAVLSGSLNNSIRSGVIDVVVGDSIGRGWGSAYGCTDWATILATTENRTNGLADPLFGFVPCQSSPLGISPLDGTQWSTLNAGANAGYRVGPLPSASVYFLSGGSWKLNATGQVIGDQPTVSASVSVTSGSNVVTNSRTDSSGVTVTLGSATVADTTISAADKGKLVASGTGIAAATYVGTVTPNTSFLLSSSQYTQVNANASVNGASVTLTGFTNGTGSYIWPGMLVTGNYIPPNTFVEGGAEGGGGTNSTMTLSQNATASGSVSLTGYRPFRRCKIYYGLQSTGASVTFATTGTVVSSGTLSTAGTGTAVWDSGDLGSNYAGTGITATAGSVGGPTAGGVIIHGVRYYQTAGNVGVTIDNFCVGGMSTTSFTPAIGSTGWATWLQMLAQAGTPARRCYVVVGLNDASGQALTPTQYSANLATMVQLAQTASPQTEVVLVAEHYGDAALSYSCVTNSTASVTNASFLNGGNPPLGSLVNGANIPAGTYVTAVGTGMAVLSQSTTSSTTTTLTFTQGRGGATAWGTQWVPAVANVAAAYGCAFINMYEVLGDISCVMQIPSVTTSSSSASVSGITAGLLNNVTVGMAVLGTGITLGTTVAAVNSSAGTLTLSAVPFSSNTGTLTFGYDVYGLGQATNPDIHFGDYSQSWSGRDAQRVFAEAFLNRLAYSNQAQSPSTVQTGTPADGKIVSALTPPLSGPGTVTFSGYANANDAYPVWELLYNPYFNLTPPGLYLGAGGSVGVDAMLTRNSAGILQTGTSVTSNGVSLLKRPSAVSVTTNVGTVPITADNAVFTMTSAASVSAASVTLAVTGAQDGQTKIVRIYDASNAAVTLNWYNTENSSVSPPTTSNGSTTHPVTVGFQYNGITSLWRCLANV